MFGYGLRLFKFSRKSRRHIHLDHNKVKFLSTLQPVVIGDEDYLQPVIIGDEDTLHHVVIGDEDTLQPVVIGDEDTLQPGVIGERTMIILMTLHATERP